MPIATSISVLLCALVVGSWVYCILTCLAARRYLQQPVPPPPSSWEPISILKPLSGLDDGLEENLRSFFAQDYPDFEILFAMRNAADPAYAVVSRLRAEYPGIPSCIILTGEPPWPNAKSYSLHLMQAQARHSLLVMSDSDIRVDSQLLRTLAREFSDPNLAVATCPYRAWTSGTLWSRLEGIGMNTEFLSGVLVARMMEGVRFALGPSIAARREAIDAVGGWPYLQQFLAEDFVLGNEAAKRGMDVALSRYIVEHRIGSQSFGKNAAHRLRWNRSTRRSRPAGYIGQLFTNPLPLALLLTAVAPWLWPVMLATVVLRAAAAYAAAGTVLHDSKLTGAQWYWIPAQDMLSFAFWIAGFFGNTIDWRGHKFRLQKNGRFERVS